VQLSAVYNPPLHLQPDSERFVDLDFFSPLRIIKENIMASGDHVIQAPDLSFVWILTVHAQGIIDNIGKLLKLLMAHS